MNIAVFGLGYVGMVNIACLSKLNHKMYGCDVKSQKVDLVKTGKSTILEPQIDELMEQGFSNGRILGSTDANFCVENTEMALICVGTPSDASGNVNLNYIINTANDIASAVKKLNKTYTIVFRSTIPPGTIEDVIIPEIQSVMKELYGRVNVVFLPEFLREGSAVKDFFNGSRIVIGLDSEMRGKKEMESVFNYSAEIPLVYTNYKTAEFVKYVDNAYHATKVTFANEIYSIGSALGVDVKRANDIFLMDNILNISPRYLKPGAPFGGSCLPKDTRAIIHLSEIANVKVPFFAGLIASNNEQQKRLHETVLKFDKRRVLIYGITFKQNTDDVRESPFLLLFESLVKQGLEVKVVDENVNVGALRVDHPEIARHLETDLKIALDWAEIVVVNKPRLKEIAALIGDNKPLINCINNESYAELNASIYNLF